MKLKLYIIKTLFLLLLFVVLIRDFSSAQTNVSIMDIVVTPVTEIDTVTGEPVEQDNTILKIMFKLNNVNEASMAKILFGTAQDSGDILTVQAGFIEDSGIYYLSNNGDQIPVNGYTAQAVVEISGQQEADYSYITLYVEDTNGQETDRLYFKK